MIEASSSANRFKESDKLTLITNKGQMVRTRAKEIRETGRNTMGVKLMDLSKGEKLQAIAPVVRPRGKRSPNRGRISGEIIKRFRKSCRHRPVAGHTLGTALYRTERPTGPWLQSRHARLLAAGFHRLITATHAVRRCSSCLTHRLRGGRGDSRLARCGSSRLGFAGTGDQHQGENRKHRTKYDCFFHSVNCLFTKRFGAGHIARRI